MSNVAEKKTKRRLGLTVNIPSSVPGSPAYLRKKYEDTMAMIAEIGAPDLFITFTGNRKWEEIEVIICFFLTLTTNFAEIS